MALTLYYRRVSGGTQPLVILHGLMGSSRNWAGLLPQLASLGLDVWALDLRNHGLSPHAPAMSYATLAADVVSTLAAHNIQRPILLGHSLGGKVAMLAACQDPLRYAGLVVVDIPPGSHAENRSTVLRFYPELAFLATLHLQAYTTRSQLEAATCDAIPAKGLRDFLLSNVVRAAGSDGATDGPAHPPSASTFVWQCNLRGILEALPTLYHTDLLAGQKPYLGPCLCIKGEHSDWIHPDDLPSFSRFFPQHHLVTVPEADHNVHSSNPQGFLQALGPFVHRLLASA